MARPLDIEREKLRLSIEIEKLRIQKERYESENKVEFWKPFEHQQRALDYLNAGKKTVLLQGGNRIGKCLTFNTLIDTPDGEISIGELYGSSKPFKVFTWNGREKTIANASVPFKKGGLHKCYRITMSDGRTVEAADHHRILMQNGHWAFVDDLARLSLLTHSYGASFHPLLLDGNRIISYDAIGLQEVYDFEVEGYHNYFAGGLIHHNTAFGACIVSSACLGVQLWDKRASIFGRKPVRVRVICVDWEHHANEVIVPALKEWLPVGSYETKKNNTGVDAFWKFKNGSTIELMTHVQDTKQHEGWKGHLVWADEPLPRDKYVANKRGLIDFSGVFLLTMTAVYEAWILDEIVLKNDSSIGCVTEVPMAANPLLSDEDIKNYSSSLTDDERQARITGGWLQLSGRVLKGFDRDVHVIEPFKVPTDWPVTPMIDFHLNTKQAIGFYAVDKNDRHYVVDEVWEHIGADEIADEIIRRKKSLSWRIDRAFIDPLSKGDTSYVKNRFGNVEDSFSIISRKLGAHGIMLEVGSKDKKSGINNIKVRLAGVNKMPSLYFPDNCERHIYEIQRWVYDEQGEPVKKDDHFMENLYRYTLSGAKYTDPVMMSDYIKMASRKYEPVNAMAGY